MKSDGSRQVELREGVAVAVLGDWEKSAVSTSVFEIIELDHRGIGLHIDGQGDGGNCGKEGKLHFQRSVFGVLRFFGGLFGRRVSGQR